MIQEKNHSYIIVGPEGMEVEILSLGATVKSIDLPGADGMTNVCLGYASLNDYKEDVFFMGATVGRFANRIDKGKFEIDGKTFQLPVNNNSNHLHGGPEGFAKRYWHLVEQTESSLTLGLLSEDGDQGYPGNLSVQAEFKLEAGMKFFVEYRATTDSATPINLSSHMYFNLNGLTQDKETSVITNHEVQLNAGQFTPVLETMIPSGDIASVAGSAFDLRNCVLLSECLNIDDSQLKIGAGFDHNFVVDGIEDEFRCFGCVRSPDSGIQMTLYSNQPGVQFYTGNFLADPFVKHAGLCLETQNFPDAPNKRQFPNSILDVSDVYIARSLFEFKQCE